MNTVDEKLQRKLEILADAAKYDASCASSGAQGRNSRDGKGIGSTTGAGICHAYTPDGRCVSLLKILMTNHCVYDCAFCVNRVSANGPRARFSVEEIVALTLGFYRRNMIEGLFLSSGIIQNEDYTMEALARVARELRLTHRFRGYIHLKAIAGADPRLIEEAGRHADRISVNTELVADASLKQLAPEKDARVIRRAMAGVRLKLDEAKPEKAKAKPPRFAPAGQSTQIIVGADLSTDRDIVLRGAQLYSSYALRRVYYSAFSPTPQPAAALPLKPAPLMREHRLYQADWLMRYYGFAPEEIFEDGPPMLDLAVDPKRAWAARRPDLFPLDVNTAPRELLLRVPGLGVRVVDRIVAARRLGALRLHDVARVCRRIAGVRPYLMTPDWTPRGNLPSEAKPRAESQLEAVRLSVVATLESPVDFDAWRGQARALLRAGARPEDVVWQVSGEAAPLPFAPPPPAAPATEIRIPRAFLSLGDLAIRHRDPERFAKLYRLLTRLAEEPRLLERATDFDVVSLTAMAKSVSRDRHKMTAFVRFREREGEGPRYVAWFEPEHLIEEHVAPFFVDRFAAMEFAIFTPRRSILWQARELRFGPGGRPDFPTDADGFSAAWDAYYRSIFNPGRLMPDAMRKEMPKKYWANMPETRQIAPLMASAAPRVESWLAAPAVIPDRRLPKPKEPPVNAVAEPLEQLKAEAAGCERCPLFERATQTVFGEGAATAKILFVGEQPGDKEDLAGRPFVGPAGAMFDSALAAAGFDRSEAYVTNAVKHFKFEPRGRIRLHKTPDTPEIVACKFWLDKELATVRAPLVVAMGATALFALTGKRPTLKTLRGRAQPFGDGRRLFVTVHPSFILRVPDEAAKQMEREKFFAEIAEAARLAREAA